MRTADLFKLAALNLSRRKPRTFMTVLGVIVGTACIVLMLSIGYSNYKQFSDMLMDNSSLTKIEINDYGNYSGAGKRSGITDSTVKSIAAMEHVEAASPVIRFPATITTGKYELSTQIYGVSADVLKLDFREGGMFASGGGMPELVIGGESAREFVDPANPPNYSDYEQYWLYSPDIDWLNASFEVQFGYPQDENENAEDTLPKGRIYRASAAGVAGDNEYNIYIDLSVAKRMLMDNKELAENEGISINSYEQVIVRVDEMKNVEAVMNEIKKLGYETYSETEYISEMQQEQNRQQGQLFAIGLISLFVSAIGIANTMYASILERRRDIGIMKVVGMKISKIRQLFLVESSLIGFLGGALGLAVSYVIVLVINTGSEQTSFLGMYFSEGMKIQIPAWVALGAIGIAVFVGVLSGIYPARKAMKMSPLEAMRTDG